MVEKRILSFHIFHVHVALFEEHECTSLTLTKKGKKNLYTTHAHIFDFLVFVQSLV